MHNFISYNPTTIHFGRDVINELGKTVSQFGNKVLLVYGKNSIKNNGIYDSVMKQLKSVNAEVCEYSGIKPNPVFEDVDAAAELGRKNNADVVLAVGGGSVIDSSKIISITIPVKNSSWDFYSGKLKPTKAIPLITVLTLAATGSEANRVAVLQNNTTGQKQGFGNNLMYPRHSFLDPQYTYSVSRDYTAYGIADLMAHAFEAYFGKGDATLSDRFIISIIKEAIEFGPKLLDNLNDYELRAKIMYAATTALNGFTIYGKVSGEWGVHSIGHTLSVLYDIPHGASLTIAYPAWLKLIKSRTDKVEKLGFEMFGTKNADDFIIKLEDFFRKILCPVRLKEVGISGDKKNEIFEGLIINNAGGNHFPLTKDDYLKLIDLML
jgi:alcohol dehydrogenase YqhD (iron-dependent ADH family)